MEVYEEVAMRRVLYVSMCIVFLACGLPGCDDDDEITLVNNYFTGLRVIHAGFDTPPVAVFLNDARAIESLEYGESSGYASILSDVYDIEITPAEDETALLISVENLVLMPLDIITIFVVGEQADIQPLIAEDSRHLLDDRARVRFVHAVPDAPAIDLKVDAGDGTQVFSRVTFPEATGYVDLAPDSYVFVVTAADDTVPLAAFEAIVLESERVYTIIAVGTLDGGDAHDFTVRVFTDNEEGIQSVDLVPADL